MVEHPKAEDKKKLPAKADNRRTNPGPSHNKSKGKEDHKQGGGGIGGKGDWKATNDGSVP